MHTHTFGYCCTLWDAQTHHSLILSSKEKLYFTAKKMQKPNFTWFLLSWLDWIYDLHKIFLMFSLFLYVLWIHRLFKKLNPFFREQHTTLNCLIALGNIWFFLFVDIIKQLQIRFICFCILVIYQQDMIEL